MRSTTMLAAAITVFAFCAHADITAKSQDGTIELTLPNGWHELKPDGATKILAGDGQGGRVAVRTFSKEDFKDMKAVAGFIVTRLKLIDNPEQKVEDLEVNGTPATRLTFVGTEPNGMRRGFVLTVLELGGEYVNITASTKASAFTKDSPILEAFAKQIVAAGPAASSPTAPKPQAPAAATGPSPTTPKPQAPARH
jgi:hypothetical protein